MTMANQFINNYKRILSAGPCMLSKGHGSPLPNQAHKMTEIGDFRFFSQANQNAFYGIKISPNKQLGGHGLGVLENIEIIGSPNDQGVRYLDYTADGLTTFAIDDAARVILTGPLTGCFVAVGRGYGNTYLFHVNENKTKNDVNQNKINKIAMLRQAQMGYWSCQLEQLLISTDYRTDGAYQAFVFGVKESGEWKFYFHCAIHDGSQWKIKDACQELPLY